MIKLATKIWSISNIDTVLLDKDGTFIDLHYFWGKMTELRALAIIKQFKLNKTYLKQLCLFLGYDIDSKKMNPEGITALYSRSKIIEIFKKDLSSIGISISESELETIFDSVSKDFYKNIKQYIVPIKEAIDFIKDLKEKKIKTGIVTSDSIESTKLTIELFKWEDLFDVIVGRESSAETKESGALTKIALNQLNATPDRTIMIGDAPMDSISALNAGIKNTILVATGQIEVADLKKHSNFVINSLGEIECSTI